ncbi:uncharacterized protein [Haliotis asinina]|uniref:uncharacterized protein n=1 Tax=Haliotis asinina TaxID=109174 RepID=UPI00353226E6
MFDDVLRQARGNLQDEDLARVVLHHQTLQYPIVIPLRPLEELNADVILSHIENVLKSHNNLALDDSFDIDIGFLDMPKGGARHNISNVEESVKEKLSIVEIKNKDNMCMARVLAVSLVKVHRVSKVEWEDLLQVDPLDQCECRFLVMSTTDKKSTHMAHLALEHKKCPPALYTNLKASTMFAHNFKGYDGYFSLDYLIQNSILHDNIVYNGSKLMSMHVPRGLNIRLLDSLSYFNTKLASLPKMFHLEELKKGYFPHYFNTHANQRYVGPYPDASFYGVNSLSTKGMSDFLQWHTEQKDKMFDFAQEMEDYCRSDVQILREALMTFRQLLLSVTTKTYLVKDPKTQQISEKKEPGIDPTDYITIASVCHGVFKHKFLTKHSHVKLLWHVKEVKGQQWVEVKPGSWLTLQAVQEAGAVIHKEETLPSPIAKVPGDGYTKGQYSLISIQWLEWLIHSHDRHIQHALNEGEYLIPGTKYKVDGYCRDSNTVYQFDGFLYHGCPTCYPHDRDKTVLPHTKQSVSEYALTMKRNAAIKEKGYELVTLWEHEFRQELKPKAELKTFVSTLDLQERLDPRDSFFGGRTNASKLFYEAKEKENILYMDFTFLYPWVNKYGQYPVGHPQIITRNFKSLDQYCGIAKVKILSPRGLYHPVLPLKSQGKLKFALCHTCAETEQQKPCQHTNEERCFIGIWCLPELLKALEKGYKILKVYEVYHWEESTRYDKTTHSVGLFASYINTFLKIKKQSSGWPAWCQSDEDKPKYVDNYLSNEGIQLETDKIEKTLA